MIIKRVEAENLKGRTFGYDLAAMNIIVGDNFTGKSSIIDAIRLPLIGHIPELGKMPSSTWQLSSGEHMTSKLIFDNGEIVTIDAHLEKTTVKVKQDTPLELANIPLLNAAAYFAMSERERYDYVFKIAKLPEAFTIDSIIAELERISFEEDHTEAIESAKSRIITLLRRSGDLVVRDWLNANIDGLKILFSQWNTRAKDTQGAIRVLAELKNRQEHQAGNVKQLAEAERSAQRAAEDAYKELVGLRTRASDYGKQEGRVARVASLRSAVADGDVVADKEKQITAAKAQLKPQLSLTSVSEAKLEQLEAHLGRLRNERQLTKMAIKDASKALDALKTATQCPYCHSTGDDWKKTLRTGFKDALELNEGKLTKIEAAFPEVEAKVVAAKTEIDRVRADLMANQTINANIRAWETEIAHHKALIAQRNEQLAEAEAALAAEKVEPVTQEQLDAAAVKATETKANLADATARLKSAELLEHDLKRAAQSEIEHNNAVAHVAVIKKIGEVLRTKQSELVDAVFGDLLKIANQIAGPILTTALAFHEGEVGRWNGHRWISHKTFSGTEQALTFVAIAAALSQGAPLRLLIFDELGRLDAKNQVVLFNILDVALTSGHIDQFILAGTTAAGTMVPGVNVIRL